jgi:rhamnose transport system permease protein
LTSRLGSTRPTIAQGWELEIISMVILGGVSVWGGKGSILGVVLAALVFGFITSGLGLMNVPGIVMSIFVGALLILVVAVPALIARLRSVKP